MPLDPFLGQSQDRGGLQTPQLRAGQWLFNRRYELQRALGAGGMGVVWLARDNTEEIEVALKFLPIVLVLQDGEMKRLREEVRAGKELRHPRLVATYGMEIEDGIAAIVMEFVPGQTLRQKLDDQDNSFFEPEEITNWVKDMTDGLAYLHDEAKRIHRDLKPANVMIDGGGRAKLMDFGISHRIKEGVSKHSKTHEGVSSASSNTLAYASPQQISGKPSTKADDIYSLGATLYELLTGTPPFFRGGMDAVRGQIKDEPPTPIMERRQELVDEGVNRSTGKTVRENIAQAVLACLTKEREKRLPDAAAIWLSFSQPAKTTATPPPRVAAPESLPRPAPPHVESKAAGDAEAAQKAAEAHRQQEEQKRAAERDQMARQAKERPLHSQPKDTPLPPPPVPANRMALLRAAFTAIFAAGFGFVIRGSIFDNWAQEFGLTATQIGVIGSMGFYGFCFGIFTGGFIVDKIGHRRLFVSVFLQHVISALVTFAADIDGAGDSTTILLLCLGMFVSASANGTLEATANPLVATLFPENRTRYLCILHAAWPAGSVVGALAGWMLDDSMHVSWNIQLALCLILTVLYGIMFMGQKFPRAAAGSKSLSFGGMLKEVGIMGGLVACALLALFFGDFLKTVVGLDQDVARNCGFGIGGALLIVVAVITSFSRGSIVLFVLFVAHALVGTMELGSDGWIQNIIGSLLTPTESKFLLIWSSVIMFGLRFCVGFIETRLKLSSLGLLLACAILACVGLNLASTITTFGAALLAIGLCAVAKAFVWPTMLAVIGDRFPHTGAVAMSIMGGIGMLSVGVIGGQAMGYSKDLFASEELKNAAPALYHQYAAPAPSTFLNLKSTEIRGLDGRLLAEARQAQEKTPAQQTLIAADQHADRATVKTISYIPAIMAVIYLLMLLYFKSQGGYKAVKIDAHP